jgi:hypothetical protein
VHPRKQDQCKNNILSFTQANSEPLASARHFMYQSGSNQKNISHSKMLETEGCFKNCNLVVQVTRDLRRHTKDGEVTWKSAKARSWDYLWDRSAKVRGGILCLCLG